MDHTVTFSDHARLRCAQRNVTEDEVLLAISVGEKLINAGSHIFFLGKRQLVRAGLSSCYDRLEGLTVHADREKDGSLCVITVYRNRKNGLRKNRRKSKYDFDRRDAA